MTVRHVLAASLAAGLLLGMAGCGGNGANVAGDETSDSLYQQAKDFEKQGRNNEALLAFLKEIDRRGEDGAPESHLEAGNLYLHWAGNPIEAYHHFYKYLELQPTGQRADMVRGQRDAAMREIAKMLQAPPSDQMVQTQTDEVTELRRRNQELEAELQTLRGTSGGVPVVRTSPPMINLGEAAPVADASAPADSIITPVPMPRPSNPSPVARAPVMSPAAPERPAATATRPASRPRNAATGSARWTHTVAQRDSLWGIARRYYGSGVTSTQVQGIYQANRDVMSSPNDLRAGMVLRIP